jgi:two-component sensor histidine kinase
MPITSTASSREALILLRELNHRHFNSLQLIAIALARCAGQPTPAQTQTKVAELVNRLHVHASLHRLLSNAPDPERLESHCLALCSNLVRMFGREDVTPYVRMDRVDLSAVQAFWISLLVAELVTNVLKHSLVDDKSGTIWVDMLNVRPDEVELRVSDSRKSSLKSQPGHGPTIVGALVEILSGTVDVLCDDAYVARICVPLEANRRDVEPTPASMVA